MVLSVKNLNTKEEFKLLEKIIMSSDPIKEVILKASSIGLKNYYIGAGCIAQTVWNYFFNKPLMYGIKDIDFVYFDDKNLDLEAENYVVRKVKEFYPNIKLELDVKNEARVHLWYKSHFGYEIKPYKTLEAAIDSWPTTATAVGVRKEKDGAFKVYAPFGLEDLLSKIVRANKKQITEEIYNEKVHKWIKKWPDLKIIPW